MYNYLQCTHHLETKVIIYFHHFLSLLYPTFYFAEIFYIVHRHPFFPSGSVSNKSACIVGDSSSIPGLGRSPGEGHGNPLQYSCLENPSGQGNLAGYSPWSHKESNTAEQLILSFTSFFFQQVTEPLLPGMPPELCVGSGF